METTPQSSENKTSEIPSDPQLMTGEESLEKHEDSKEINLDISDHTDIASLLDNTHVQLENKKYFFFKVISQSQNKKIA